MAKATGTMRREAYFTENLKTFPSISCSSFESILEKAGNSTVNTGMTKKVTMKAKFNATW